MGWFVTFDGIDGAGKTTQMQRFVAWLRQRGQEVAVCRDPGSTPLGETLRALLLAADGPAIGRTAEMLLYMAARAQLVEEVITPALAAGKTVVSDRFLLANVVYQGHAGGLDVAALWDIGRVATGGLVPHLTFVLDLEPQQAQARLDRTLDRMEQQGDEYLRRVREGFLVEARRRTEVVVIDAARSIDTIAAEIQSIAAQRLK